MRSRFSLQLHATFTLPLRAAAAQGRNQLGAEGAAPPPPVKSWAPSKMWLFIVLARCKREKRVFSLAQYCHNSSKVSWIIINTIKINIKLKLQNLLYN